MFEEDVRGGVSSGVLFDQLVSTEELCSVLVLNLNSDQERFHQFFKKNFHSSKSLGLFKFPIKDNILSSK